MKRLPLSSASLFAISFCAILAGVVPALAQRDFLTEDEVEKVREAQLPNDRLKLYALFAKQRLDQLQRLLEKEKKGRSLAARELLEDYSGIIDAIDTVSDDALKRGVDIGEGTVAVTTSDSIDLATEDVASRGAKLSAEDKKAKEEAEKTLAAEDSKGKPPEEAKTADAKPDDGKPKRKPPTLMRPGEKPPDAQ